MGTVPANPQLVDVLDTFYNYVRNQYQKVNAARPLFGFVNAQDWPQVELQDGTLYLLYLNSVPVEEDSTRAQIYYEHYVQWAWVWLGDDLAANQVGLNRGSRYRDDMTIKEELRQTHFPGFCVKQFSSCDPATGQVTFTPYSSGETIQWSMPRMGTKLAMAQSGISYGSAAFEIYGWSSVGAAVNS